MTSKVGHNLLEDGTNWVKVFKEGGSELSSATTLSGGGVYVK